MLDVGGLGGQVGTDATTAESFAKLTIAEGGSYRVTVAPPPELAAQPTVTLGESTSSAIGRALKRAGRIVGIAAAIALILFLTRLARRRVEYGQGRMEKRPLPVRVDCPAELFFAGRRYIITLREIQICVVLRRLIRPHDFAALFVHQ